MFPLSISFFMMTVLVAPESNTANIALPLSPFRRAYSNIDSLPVLSITSAVPNFKVDRFSDLLMKVASLHSWMTLGSISFNSARVARISL